MLPPLNDDASDEICMAHNHLRTTHEALREKMVAAREARNKLIVQQLLKHAVKCRELCIDTENKRMSGITRELDGEVATMELSRKAALVYFRTLYESTSSSPKKATPPPAKPPATPGNVVENLEKAKSEAAHWKRQFEEVQKELSADKKRHKPNEGEKEDVESEEKANGDTRTRTDESDNEKESTKKDETTTESKATPDGAARADDAAAAAPKTKNGVPDESNNNLQMVAEVLTNMRSTVQSTFGSTDAQSSGNVRRLANTPENQTQPVRRRTRCTSLLPNILPRYESPAMPHPFPNSIHTRLEPRIDATIVEETENDIIAGGYGADLRPYTDAYRNIGVKMVSKRYAQRNPAPDDRARAFLADLAAFLEELGEKPPKQMKIDGGPLCSYRLMRIVCGFGGIRYVVQNGRMRSVMQQVGVKKVTNSTRIKCYYAHNLYRYERMLAHGVLLPSDAGERIKTLTWRKGRVGAPILPPVDGFNLPLCEVAGASASTVADNNSEQVDENFAK